MSALSRRKNIFLSTTTSTTNSDSLSSYAILYSLLTVLKPTRELKRNTMFLKVLLWKWKTTLQIL